LTIFGAIFYLENQYRFTDPVISKPLKASGLETPARWTSGEPRMLLSVPLTFKEWLLHAVDAPSHTDGTCSQCSSKGHTKSHKPDLDR